MSYNGVRESQQRTNGRFTHWNPNWLPNPLPFRPQQLHVDLMTWYDHCEERLPHHIAHFGPSVVGEAYVGTLQVLKQQRSSKSVDDNRTLQFSVVMTIVKACR
jgi:hypothetical protein